MSYYLGVDGGGTKTVIALFDETKALLCSVKIGGTNHENMAGGIPEAADALMAGIEELLAKSGVGQGQAAAALFALAGMDHPYQEEEMRAALTVRGLKIPFTVCNDGFIVVKAGLTGKAGIGYNCGTGTCCNSVDDDGKLLQIGGFGELSGDVGGGLWIAGRTFRLLYDDVCLKARPTACVAAICRLRGISADRAGVLSLIPLLEDADDGLVRDLIDVFFAAYNAGDPAAERVGEEMALRGAEYIAAHLKNGRFADDPVEVVLSGSIHTKLPSEKYVRRLAEEAERLGGRRLSFIRLAAAPVTGCINWLLEKERGN